jgi:hypothetical protein
VGLVRAVVLLAKILLNELSSPANMIEIPTVFIVGAGASTGYSMPTGVQLKKEAVALSRESDAARIVLTVLNKQGLKSPGKEFPKFLEDLKQHPSDSIDEFLEKRREQPFSNIGRLVIAALMGKALHAARENRNPISDWLRHVAQMMLKGPSTLTEFRDNNKCAFVTFNFDTFIEARLRAFISSGFGVDVGPISGYFPVTHVHGKLEPIPDGPMVIPPPVNSPVPLWVDWVESSAKNINVTADTIDDSILTAARNTVEEAGVVCFMGFGYNRINLDRLGFPRGFDPQPKIFGSAYGLSSSSCEAVKSWIPNIQLASTGMDCLQTLHHLPIIREI